MELEPLPAILTLCIMALSLLFCDIWNFESLILGSLLNLIILVCSMIVGVLIYCKITE